MCSLNINNKNTIKKRKQLRDQGANWKRLRSKTYVIHLKNYLSLFQILLNQYMCIERIGAYKFNLII